VGGADVGQRPVELVLLADLDRLRIEDALDFQRNYEVVHQVFFANLEEVPRDLSEEVERGNAGQGASEDERLEAVQKLVVVLVGEVFLLYGLSEDSFEEIVLALDFDHILDQAFIGLLDFLLHQFYR
jgi:hypothetical protein